MKDKLYMKFPNPEAYWDWIWKTSSAEDVFQIQSPICGANFSNNISIAQVRVNERKPNLTFEIS